MFSRFILAVKKFFMIVGIVSITIGCTVIYMKAGDTSPKVSVAEMPRVKTKAEKIREMDAANSGTAVVIVMASLIFAGFYFFVLKGKKPEPEKISVPKPENPKALPINLESEDSLIKRYCYDYNEDLTVIEIYNLITNFPDYQVLHLTLLEKYKNDLNYPQLCLIQKAGKETKNEELGHKVRNLQKFWTQSKKAKARSKYENRRYYECLLPPLLTEEG